MFRLSPLRNEDENMHRIIHREPPPPNLSSTDPPIDIYNHIHRQTHTMYSTYRDSVHPIGHRHLLLHALQLKQPVSARDAILSISKEPFLLES